VNSVLPAAIELYLKEANFSTTEMMILKKLLEQDALTLRELASKSGKSTGVLDIAMKKLLRKGIAKRTVINGTMRYCIDSLDSIAAWVKHDMEERQQDMRRKHQSFEYFIASLKVDKKRPDMEHFTGLEGLKQAYTKLLESGYELLTVTPILYRAEDDPLRDFKVEFFKKRQGRKIFQRIIAPDAPLTRRFQSRDMFEYRRTVTLPSSDFSIGFERTIVGDTVACFNFQDETACLLKYPELAGAERSVFENLWSHALGQEQQDQLASPRQMTMPILVEAPLSTRIGSSIRQFILSWQSIATFSFFGLLSAAVTVGLYTNTQNINLQRMQEKAMSIATTGALHFSTKELDQLRTEADWEKPEWSKVVHTLMLIRRHDPDIYFAYIIRKVSDDDTQMEFVADSHSLNPYANSDADLSNDVDVNQNDLYDGPDILQWPGQKYDTAPNTAFEAYNGPTTTPSFYEDQWGKMITGYAPMYDEDGNVSAVLAIDIIADKLEELTAQNFSPLFVFIIFFFLFIFVRYAAINKPLLQQCWAIAISHRRLLILWLVFIIAVIVALTMLYQWHLRQLRIEEMGKRLMAIAVTAAGEFDPADLDQLHWARDMKTEAYQRVFRQLNEIRHKNPEITFAYIFRVTEDEKNFIFVADADSNWNLPVYSKYILDDTGTFDETDENVAPGVVFDDSVAQVMAPAMRQPSYGLNSLNQWGRYVEGFAPIYNKDGIAIAVLGFDVELETMK